MSTLEALDRAQMIKTFGKDAADFVEDAVLLGWKVLVNSTGTSITLKPYDDSAKRIHLSSRNRTKGGLRKHIRVLVKYADPARVSGVSKALEDKNLSREARTQVLTIMSKTLGEVAEVEHMQSEPPKERFVKPEVEKVQQQAAKKVQQERHIVSERPHLMHKRLGKSYPSKTTIERRWSDGVIDYVCAVPTCGMVSDNHLSFRGAHWAMHVRKGEGQPFDIKETQAVVDDPSYTEHAWTRKAALRAQRREALIALLKQINFQTLDVEVLADQVIEFYAPREGDADDKGPLTDTQVLDRIRSLVDRGMYAEQEKAIRERDQQIEELSSYADQQMATLRKEALEAEQRAIKAESTMQALRELVADMIPEGG